MYVTEDTTRSQPGDARACCYRAPSSTAPRGSCLCDTVGHATPDGVRAWSGFVRERLGPARRVEVKIDWHGHRDRGLALTNALAAIEAGADRVHGTGLGIGERVGNCPMDLLLVNLKLLGWIDHDLTQAERVLPGRRRDYCGYPIPANYPVVGADAFRTGTGVHAAAIIKAIAKEDPGWPTAVYSGVPRRRVRPRAGHRDRPDERQVERAVLAQASAASSRGPSSSTPSSTTPRARPRTLEDNEIYRIIVERFVSTRSQVANS